MELVSFVMQDNSFIKVSANRDALTKISNHLKYYSPGLKFSNPRSNGYISLFSVRQRLLPIGILSSAVNILKDEYKIVFCKNLKDATLPLECDIPKFISSLSIPFKLRQYQIASFSRILRQKRIVIEAPTSSGKTLMLYLIIRYLCQSHNIKVLILLPNNMLQSQLISDFYEYGWQEVEENISFDKNSNSKIICTTWQNLQSNLKNDVTYFQRFNAVFVDEAHTASAYNLKSILEYSTHAFMKVGLTGTLSEDDASRAIIRGLFGKSYIATTNKKLNDDNIIPNLVINIINLQYPTSDVYKKLSYDDECVYIQKSNKRKKFIVELINSLDKNSIIIGTNVEFLKTLSELVSDKKISYIMDAGTNIKIRENILKSMESGENKILFGTYNLLKCGISVKNFKNLVFVQSRKSFVSIRQSIGRVLRKHPDIPVVNVFDIVDELKYTKYHARARIRIYETEEMDYRFSSVIL